MSQARNQPTPFYRDSEEGWSKRAWALRERILSRMCFVFAEGRIYLQSYFAIMV